MERRVRAARELGLKIHAQIKEYVDAGFTHVYLHQVGPDQERFIDMAKREILPSYA